MTRLFHYFFLVPGAAFLEMCEQDGYDQIEQCPNKAFFVVDLHPEQQVLELPEVQISPCYHSEFHMSGLHSDIRMF